MGTGNGNAEFLFEIARKDIKEKIAQDINAEEIEGMPNFVELYNSYVGSDPEKKTAADQSLRDLVKDNLSNAKFADTSQLIADMLNIITASVSVAKQGFCSPSIPFILLGDVLDCLTLDACDVVFKYIEERVGIWKAPLFYTAGKNYLLRMCNDLLRRLSQSKNTIFCGRIQLFLARLFPLSEKSALNLVSQFNLENITVFNKDSENTTLNKETEKNENETMDIGKASNEDDAAASKDSGIVDYNLYKSIWSLQDIFRYPVQCYTKEVWEKFTENADCVFRVFSSYKLEEVCRSNTTILPSQPTSRAYFSKFLTSEKLTNLQLNDGLFRRQILTQFLILFRYLTATVKFKGTSLVLTEQMKSWISEAEPRIFNLLEETPPDGKRFTKYIKHLMKREEFWITWKNDGCPSFTKSSPKSSEEEASPAVKRRKTEPQTVSIVDEFVAGKGLGMGSPELTRLWNLCPDNLAACESVSREFIPSLYDYFVECVEQADPKNAIEEQYKLVNKSNFQWKALRLLSHRSQLFFTSQPAQMQFKTVPDYLNTIISKLATDFPTTTPVDEVAEPDTEGIGESEDAKDVAESDDVKDTEETDDVLGEEEEEMDEDDANLMDESQDESNQDQQNAAVLDSLSSDDVTNFASKIASEWKKLAPYLDLKPKDMKEIEEDSDDDVLRARQTLVTWQDLAGKDATWSTLVQALKSAGLDTLVEE